MFVRVQHYMYGSRDRNNIIKYKSYEGLSSVYTYIGSGCV